MASIVPGRRYTRDEIALMRSDPQLAKLQLEGYVLRGNLDGTMQFVHWTKSATGEKPGSWNPALQQTYAVDTSGLFVNDRIVRRTAQARVDSLVKKWWDTCRRHGTIPGLTDAQISAMIGEDWKSGQRELTIDDVRKLAAFMLQDSENKKTAADFKKTVKPSSNS